MENVPRRPVQGILQEEGEHGSEFDPDLEERTQMHQTQQSVRHDLHLLQRLVQLGQVRHTEVLRHRRGHRSLDGFLLENELI